MPLASGAAGWANVGLCPASSLLPSEYWVVSFVSRRQHVAALLIRLVFVDICVLFVSAWLGRSSADNHYHYPGHFTGSQKFDKANE